MTGGAGVSPAVERLLTAIESRDLRAITAALHPDATWQNLPHPPAVGRPAVIEMLAPIITWSDLVRWELRSHCARGDMAWIERADHFWIDGDKYTVKCNGVVITEGGAVREVRDYSDLGEWRERIVPVYQRMEQRSSADVVRRHIAAVAAMDPVSMAADYSLDAVLERGTSRFSGHAAIADYFESVPTRLGTSVLVFDELSASGENVTVTWRIHDDLGSTVSSGLDEYVVDRGRITYQTVNLEGSDF